MPPSKESNSYIMATKGTVTGLEINKSFEAARNKAAKSTARIVPKPFRLA